MTIPRTLSLSAALGLITGSLSVASTATYTISAHLAHEGHPFAAPVIVVREGEPTTVEVTGNGGYRLTVTVTPVTPGSVRVDTDLRTAYGATSPAMVVQIGQPASVSVGDIQMTLTAEAHGR